MGFWHTGYEEFHEPTGFGDWTGPDLTMRFNCERCDASFDSLEALRKHRFESHPLRQPRAFFQGLELGAQPVKIRSAFQSQDLEFAMVDEARVNGLAVPLPRIATHLASLRDEFVHLDLIGAGVTVSHKVDIEAPRVLWRPVGLSQTTIAA